MEAASFGGFGRTLMAEADVRLVSSATGTFAALKPQLQSDVETGNTIPEAGNSVPVPESPQPNMEELARAVNVANQTIGRDLRIEVDMESGESVIQVLDRDTGEVIRQIPPEKASFYMSNNGAMQLRLYSSRV